MQTYIFFLDVSHGDIRRLGVCLFDYNFLHKFISLLTQILAKIVCNPAGSARLFSELFDELWSHSLLLTLAVFILCVSSGCLTACLGALW